MQDKLNELKSILAEVSDLNKAASVLGWDQQTYMPRAGAEARGQQMGTLGKIAHEKFTDEKVGKLLDELKDAYHPESDEFALIKVTRRQYEKSTRVPAAFVAEQAEVTAAAHEGWVEARQKSDYSIFEPHLTKVMDLTKRYIDFFPKADHPYDTLLDDYEPGMKTAEVQAIFAELRKKQVRLLQAIAEKKQVDDSFLHKKYPEAKQRAFGEKVITAFGFDWNKNRQDKAPHPFCTSFSINDVRITTRFNEKFLNAALFGTMHETGHALYDGGINPAYERTPLADGASLGVHESQSRLWENLVGRSLPFWEHFYPELQAIFPSQLGNVKLRDFYRAINKVEPSLIRVEADEATYNMHIMLRLEIEIAMVEGAVALKDLPELWNTKMKEYLGIVPPNDALGVLQDIHWSFGGLGYFSTYALGNLISAQLWEKINAEITDLSTQIRAGKFDSLLGWLRANIHIHGRKYEPQELVKKVTGSKIDPAPYLRYLEAKFSDVYGLK
jgi:carboxypeptidase Taq